MIMFQVIFYMSYQPLKSNSRPRVMNNDCKLSNLSVITLKLMIQ